MALAIRSSLTKFRKFPGSAKFGQDFFGHEHRRVGDETDVAADVDVNVERVVVVENAVAPTPLGDDQFPWVRWLRRNEDDRSAGLDDLQHPAPVPAPVEVGFCATCVQNTITKLL